MKRFYLKAVLFLVLFTAAVIGLEALSIHEEYRMFIARLTDSEEYITENTGSDEIKPYIAKVQEENAFTKLVIGDSVCHQMYKGLQEYNEDCCIVGSNAAITLAGQYILAKEFLDSHENATDIYLILIPTALQQGFDTKYGYQYVVMPFVETGTVQNLDPETIGQLENIYGRFFMNKKIVELIDRSAVNRKLYLNELARRVKVEQQPGLSDVSARYLEKLIRLCEAENVNLHLYPGPLADTDNKRSFVRDRLGPAFEQSGFSEYFPDYIDGIRYYPEEQFADGVHFGGEWANQAAYNEKIKEMYQGEKLLKDLNLGE